MRGVYGVGWVVFIFDGMALDHWHIAYMRVCSYQNQFITDENSSTAP